MAKKRALLLKLSEGHRQRLEGQATAARRSLTAQIVWWITTTSMDGITPIAAKVVKEAETTE